jgi:hypothetical protein
MALVRLTLYICLAGLSLGIERVEFEIEVMLGRLPRVDGAPEQLLGRLIHAATLAGCESSDWAGSESSMIGPEGIDITVIAQTCR